MKSKITHIILGSLILNLLIIFYIILTSEYTTVIYFEQKEDEVIEVIVAPITAYSEIDSCHYEGCPMANGLKARTGYIACPRSLDLGVRVKINDRIYICGDRTAKRYDGRFDIFIGYGEESYQKAVEFGINTLEIYVLK